MDTKKIIVYDSLMAMLKAISGKTTKKPKKEADLKW